MNLILTKSINPTRSVGKFEAWLYGMFNAVLIGGSTSVTTWLGMAAAKGAGLDVPTLNLKAVVVIFISGAAVKFFAYLSAGLPNLNAEGDQVSNTVPTPTTGQIIANAAATQPTDAEKLANADAALNHPTPK